MPSQQQPPRPKPATLAELLREEYELDPGAIEYLIEESLLHGADYPVQIACHLLGGEVSTAVRQNLSSFIRRAVATDVEIRANFDRAARKFGRCPKGEKGWLRRQIDSTDRQLPTPSVPHTIAARREVVPLEDQPWAIDALPQLISRLGRARTDRPEVEVRLGQFAYASALAVLAEWILSNGIVNRHEISCGPQMQGYLDRMRFSTALTGC